MTLDPQSIVGVFRQFANKISSAGHDSGGPVASHGTAWRPVDRSSLGYPVATQMLLEAADAHDNPHTLSMGLQTAAINCLSEQQMRDLGQRLCRGADQMAQSRPYDQDAALQTHLYGSTGE